jgi:hypothetical protein
VDVVAEVIVDSTVSTDAVVVSGALVIVVSSEAVVDWMSLVDIEVASTSVVEVREDISSNVAEDEMMVANVVDEPSIDVTSSKELEKPEADKEGSAIEVVSTGENRVAEDWKLEAGSVPDEATDEGDGLHTLASTAPSDKSARTLINFTETIVTGS